MQEIEHSVVDIAGVVVFGFVVVVVGGGVVVWGISGVVVVAERELEY